MGQDTLREHEFLRDFKDNSISNKKTDTSTKLLGIIKQYQTVSNWWQVNLMRLGGHTLGARGKLGFLGE